VGRGAAMASASTSVALLLTELGVTKTHSRPHVSNDNPFCGAQFKTLTYRPTFPARFGWIEDARGFCSAFFIWHNTMHRHSGLGLNTPCDIHQGRATARRAQRPVVLNVAYQATPDRFVNTPPVPAALPTAAWTNPPAPPPTAPAAQ